MLPSLVLHPCKAIVCGLILLHHLLLLPLPEETPPSPPAKPPIFPRAPQQTHEERAPNASDRVTPACDPPTLSVEPVADGGPRELAAKGEDHEGRVDAVARAGRDGVDGGAVRDLGGLHAHVEQKGLEDGARHGEGARVGAQADAEDAEGFAQKDAPERGKAVDDEAAIEGDDAHGADADEGEEADDEGGVVVGWAREEEGQGGPEAGERGRGEEADEAGLEEDGVLEEHNDDGAEDAEVGLEAAQVRIGGGVVGHEEPQEDEDEVLQPQGEPVHVPPRGILGHGARDDACDEDAEHEAGHDDAEGRAAAVRGRQVADQGQHDLGGHGCHGRDEGDGGEGGQRLGHAETDPT